MRNLTNNCLVGICVIAIFMCLSTVTVQGSFTFSLPEQMLSDPGSESTPQWNADICFDSVNRLHAVWVDTIFSTPEIYGTVVNRMGQIQHQFNGYHPLIGNDYYMPFMQKNLYDTNKMCVFAIEDFSGPYVRGVNSEWDLSTLPLEPGVTNINTFDLAITTSPSTRNDIDVVSSGNYLIYAYAFYPDLHLNRFNVVSQAWESPEIIIAGGTDTLLNPSLAAGDDGYIYLAYNKTISSSIYELIVCRSNGPGVINGFLPARLVATNNNEEYKADIVVAGNVGSEHCALVYRDAQPTTPEAVCSMETAGDWYGTWGGAVTTYSTIWMSSFMGPNAAYDADGETLYVVWADNRYTDDEVFGVVSYNAGLTFQNVNALTNNAQSLIQAPIIATGPDSGNLAIAYCRNNGTGTSPYVLFSMPEFFDKCDSDPSNYWDGSSGVVVDSIFSQPYTAPACYRLETASKKGQLINHYSVEQQGGIDLYFYDDTSITTQNFSVIIENANAKGVIRMLGVRNETTQSNYSYYNGSWIDWSVPRSTGWHHIVMTASEENGLEMSLEYSPGSTAYNLDFSFQYFTDITIEGGDTGSPYYVDDIEVHALPVTDDEPIPASSTVSLLLLLAGISILLVWYSKK